MPKICVYLVFTNFQSKLVAKHKFHERNFCGKTMLPSILTKRIVLRVQCLSACKHSWRGVYESIAQFRFSSSYFFSTHPTVACCTVFPLLARIFLQRRFSPLTRNVVLTVQRKGPLFTDRSLVFGCLLYQSLHSQPRVRDNAAAVDLFTMEPNFLCQCCRDFHLLLSPFFSPATKTITTLYRYRCRWQHSFASKHAAIEWNAVSVSIKISYHTQ